MESIKYINIVIELFGCVFCCFLIFLMKYSNQEKDKLYNKYILVLATNIGIDFSDMIAGFFRGNTAEYGFVIVRVSNFLVYFFGYLCIALFTDYLMTFIEKKSNPPQWIRPCSWSICGVGVLLLLVSQFNGMYYIIDSANLYIRQNLFWLAQILGIICMMLNGCMLLIYQSKLSRREFFSLVTYIVLPTAAMILQMCFYGIAFQYVASTLTLGIIYVGVQAEQARINKEKEIELTQSRIAIMLSQIQPHFLYNSLNSIYYLCEKDPLQAQKAIGDFSEYLRANLDSIKRTRPVPFDQELRHIQIYLSLEKMRFDDELNIEYNIETTAFLIPALTVQPLVENAVKYGVGKSEHGGTVKISTKEYPDHYEIIIEDDGVGYSNNKVQFDGRTHIGIDNVRQRITMMSNGTLNIVANEGMGTTAVITLPKEKKE